MSQEPPCWCAESNIAPFSPEYRQCVACGTLVSVHGLTSEETRVSDDERAFYGREYWFSHQEKDLGFPDILSRARTDLPERCLHWLRTLLRYKVPPGRVLELGSAHGGFVALLRWAGFDATGLDLSPWVIDFARRAFGIPVLLGPVEEQRIEPGSLDVIALMDVLEHLVDPVGTMRHCLGLLKADGILVIQTPAFPEGKGHEAMLSEGAPFLAQLKAREHVYLFSPRSVRELFRGLGAGWVSFEPAIFDHYDMCLVVGRVAAERCTPEDVAGALSATPGGRLVQALLDAAESRDAATRGRGPVGTDDDGSHGPSAPADGRLAGSAARPGPRLMGVWADGWIGAWLEIAHDGGAEGRVVELAIEVPRWLPGRVLTIQQEAHAALAERWVLARGKAKTIRLSIPAAAGQTRLGFSPLCRPRDRLSSTDARLLSCMCASCAIVSPGGSRVKLFEATRPGRASARGPIERIAARLAPPRLGQLVQHAPQALSLPRRYRATAVPPRRMVISIATATLNSVRFVERTIRSVIGQEYPWLEYVVQDGGSGDGTVEILERYRDRMTSLESAKDGGQSEALNRAFRRTTGEILAYLSSDDLLLPGALRYVARYFATHPEADVVYGHRVLIDEEDRQIGRWVLPRHDDDVLTWADYVPQETLFWRRRIWDRIGGRFDERFQCAMDWDLLLRFRAAGARFARLPRFLGAFRVHPAQKTVGWTARVGPGEIARLLERQHGRVVSRPEVDDRVRRYLARHVIHDTLYRLGLLRY